ncbi:hypothetical protein P170DRAFT_424507 [Aspergillus steynii IBT 23096]|uniref:P-loop containing nucleoside triphosphate hydrolase protein n=1 Tax=Aspergillus steynii IBT 23096 TaxID=1392250 RepID=A0A2I2GB22_9EURO|nr:uncharacterized protein P170DRAFT_424507 [Aspergillus steynii IBT 23096]PLB50083.1 hypothetical protein P170DRAFT_424507 [Aspergillus steynii IBT 23096]
MTSAFPGPKGASVWLPDPLEKNLKAAGYESLTLSEDFIVQNVVQGKDVELVKGMKDGRSPGALIAVIKTLLVTPARAHPRTLFITSSHESAKAVGEMAESLLKDAGIVQIVRSVLEGPARSGPARSDPALVIATAGKTLEAFHRGLIVAEDPRIVVINDPENLLGARSQAVSAILKKSPERHTLVCVTTGWDARTLLDVLQAAGIDALIFNNTVPSDAREDALRSYSSTDNPVRVLLICNISSSGILLRNTSQIIYHSIYHDWDIMHSLIVQAHERFTVYIILERSESPAAQDIIAQFLNTFDPSNLRPNPDEPMIESEDIDLSGFPAA